MGEQIASDMGLPITQDSVINDHKAYLIIQLSHARAETRAETGDRARSLDTINYKLAELSRCLLNAQVHGGK